MAIGSFGSVVFTVSDNKILTFSGLAGSAGADWAQHATVGGKPKSQYIGPKLRKYDFEIELNAQLGVRPRAMLEQLQQMAEGNGVYWLIVGGAPIAQNPFKLVEVSDEWETVLNRGELARCKVKLTVEEYL